VGEVRTPGSSRKGPLLMRTDGTVRLVVGDDDLDIELAGNGGCQLIPGHQETAISAKRDNLTIRMTKACAQCRRNTTAHRTAGRAEQSGRRLEAEYTVYPGGEVAGVGRHNTICSKMS